MGGAMKPQQRLNRPQGCGQHCHTPHSDHSVMNIIKQAGRGRVPRYVERTPSIFSQRWEELGNHNKVIIDHKGVVNNATPIILATGS